MPGMAAQCLRISAVCVDTLLGDGTLAFTSDSSALRCSLSAVTWVSICCIIAIIGFLVSDVGCFISSPIFAFISSPIFAFMSSPIIDICA